MKRDLKLNFSNEEVMWHIDDIPVYGTITSPNEENISAAAIFIAGSGPTDRDWCSPLLPGKNGSAKLLAEELAKKGIITLRYDKRASGPHAQENFPKMIGKISMQSHIDEVSGAVQTLLTKTNIDPDRLFVITSSEGAIHALNYQLQQGVTQFKGLILTGAPGRSISKVVQSQVEEQVKLLPDTESVMKNYYDAISAFEKGETVVPEASLPEFIKQLLLGLTYQGNLPFARELWSYDPSSYITKVKAPILVIIGKKDIQVDWRMDGLALDKATSNQNNVTFVYPENADHVLKHEETPRKQLTGQATLHYNEEGRILDNDVLNAIYEYILTHTRAC